MKHCILMTVYKDVEQINRIIEFAPENFDFYVHIDKKSKLTRSDISKRANVFSEYRIYWGAVEHLKAFLFLMNKAFHSEKRYDFYHLITGQDFYATSFDNFEKLLEKDKIYISYFNLPRKKWWHGGFAIVRYKSFASKLDLRKRSCKVLNYLYYICQRLFTRGCDLPSYRLYGGLVYCSICGGAIKWVLDSEISRDLLNRLENTTCGEELFFQTVLLNSPFSENIINNNLRIMDWNVKSPPKVLREEDFHKIIDSNCLFCRKVDSKASKMLIKLLMNKICLG